MGQEKFRNELKYICSPMQLRLIQNRIKDICHPDPHGGADGTYLITSVYFDDYNNNCYYEIENGIEPREKFRIRIYNRQMNYIALECKHKQFGKTFKEACSITQKQCHAFLHQRWFDTMESEALINRFYIANNTKCLRPKVIVEYERTAYIYPQGNVRVTFDKYITTSTQIEDFGKQVMRRPVLPVGQQILEVKYDEMLPDFLYNALQVEHLRHMAFSKYYICRRFINIG